MALRFAAPRITRWRALHFFEAACFLATSSDAIFFAASSMKKFVVCKVLSEAPTGNGQLLRSIVSVASTVPACASVTETVASKWVCPAKPVSPRATRLPSS